MALSDIGQVRMGIGDTTTPYILSDAQIQHYLNTHSGNVAATTIELQPMVLSALASRGSVTKVGDLSEDTTKRADNYTKALKMADKKLGQTASPILGGCVTASPFSVDQFDPTNVLDEETGGF